MNWYVNPSTGWRVRPRRRGIAHLITRGLCALGHTSSKDCEKNANAVRFLRRYLEVLT